MVGERRENVLGLTSPDPVLSLVGSLGLSLCVGTALMVDLEAGSAGGRSLATIAVEGPTREELSPGRPGVAVLRRGPISVDDGLEVVARLAEYWPAVVVRGVWPQRTVPYLGLYPGWLRPDWGGTAVWQPLGSLSRPTGPGPVLPALRPGVARALIEGRSVSRSRWVTAWRQVWGLSWV